MPKLSVLMPVYNAARYLSEAIESILTQSYRDFEFIIINDGSTDSSEEIIRSFNDERIVYIKNDTNIGVIQSLNKGILLAAGQYIARMDADDIAAPARLEVQLNYLEKNCTIGLCGTWADTIDGEGIKTGVLINQTEPELIRINLLFSVPIIHPTVMGRTSYFKDNLYPNKNVAEDYALWVQLSKKVDIANIPHRLLQYRWHTSNVSQEKAATQLDSKQQIIREQLSLLGLSPSQEELFIHTLSFNLHGHERSTYRPTKDDLDKTAAWFDRLINANDECKEFNSYSFRAFLWGRWIVLCLAGHKKMKVFNPSFKSLHPKVIVILLQQMLLLSKKK